MYNIPSDFDLLKKPFESGEARGHGRLDDIVHRFQHQMWGNLFYSRVRQFAPVRWRVNDSMWRVCPRVPNRRIGGSKYCNDWALKSGCQMHGSAVVTYEN